jgi:pyrimidine-nucleoside phosphorylase
MNPVQIIAAKRDGSELTDDQIRCFVTGFTDESIPDYQMSALAMAIFLNGMNDRETATLTHCMLNSGTRLQWPDDGVPRVDKHSTGGVGDKVSLVLAPLLAACDLQVPMLSGRGLGPTGGTLDKLEAIPGFRTDLSLDEITTLTQRVGCVITGASQELAPADRRLYALRDVTATVPSIPLITASIMSKKLAESLDCLVLDVKFGSGAFMKTQQQARQLAESLVAIGHRMGVTTTALLTDMNQPLGQMCGNAVEVQESIDVLQGNGPEDVRQLTIELAAELLVSAARQPSAADARQHCENLLNSGHAFEKFQQMVTEQGGAPGQPLTVATAFEVTADADGFVSAVDTESLGLTIINMNGGRRKLSDAIDHSTGIRLQTRIGDAVQQGQPLATVFCDRDADLHAQAVRSAIHISDQAAPVPLIVDHITS